MKCIITYTDSTENEDFYGEGADAKVPTLGSREVTLSSIFGPIKENGVDAEIMKGMKDPPVVATSWAANIMCILHITTVEVSSMYPDFVSYQNGW